MCHNLRLVDFITQSIILKDSGLFRSVLIWATQRQRLHICTHLNQPKDISTSLSLSHLKDLQYVQVSSFFPAAHKNTCLLFFTKYSMFLYPITICICLPIQLSQICPIIFLLHGNFGIPCCRNILYMCCTCVNFSEMWNKSYL